MSRSSKKEQAIGEDVGELSFKLAIIKEDLKEAKELIVVLRRELGAWQARAERSELECRKWKATANEWKREFMKTRS